jgi:hypothetical protein
MTFGPKAREGPVQAQRLNALLVLASLLSPALAGAQRAASVSGSVTDATSRRSVEGAIVQFSDGLVAVTDRRGDFKIKVVPAGTYRVRVSRIGYRPKRIDLPIDRDDRTLYMEVSLEPLPVQLEPVVVRGDTSTIVAYGRRLAEFYRRRHQGIGRFITRQDIDRRSPNRVSDLFWNVPGAWISYDPLGQASVTFRGMFTGFGGGALGGFGRCPAAWYIDGMRMPTDMGSLDNWVLPEQVEGIEVYNGIATVPLEFYGGCGAIVVWTR